ncbi:MAG: N-acetylmuramoyl-L-alanine amidase [Lachnospiraceae bacterium]|nr:N-acetylmuramoyl-L-alanine amidase [Lachnospiraceae bacterium]
MKNYKSSVLAAIVFMFMVCITGINTYAAQTESTTTATEMTDIRLNYTVLDSSQLTTPQTQKILVSAGELGAKNISFAQLTLKEEETGVKTTIPAEVISEDAMLFSIDYTDNSQQGIYILEALDFTYNGAEQTIAYEETIKYAVNEDITTTPDEVVTDDVEVTADVIQLDKNESLEASDLTAALGENVAQTTWNPFVRGAKTKGDMIIVLDPGHGGSDPGAVANGLREKDLTLKIATYCKEELEKYSGIKIYMTRTGDTYPTLDERVAYATEMKADVFVSFHINSFYTSSASGTEVYYPNANYKSDIGAEGKGLAEAVLKKLVELGLKNRGVKYTDSSTYTYPDGSKADGYAVIRGSKNAGIPGILIEHAFISNPSDAQNYLGSDAALKKLGVADAAGIIEYYKLKLKTGDETEEDEEGEEPGEAEIVKLTAKDGKKVTIKWTSAEEAAGYRIYRSTKLNGTYKNIALIENPQTLTYKDATVKAGKTYYYKVSPYNAKEEGELSEAESIKILKTPEILSIKRSKSQLKITWKKVKNVTKYQIFRSETKDGTYTRIKTVSSKTSYYVDKTVMPQKKYYYKIRAYASGLDGKSYSAYSIVKGKKTK